MLQVQDVVHLLVRRDRSLSCGRYANIIQVVYLPTKSLGDGKLLMVFLVTSPLLTITRAFLGQAPLCAVAFTSVALILHLPKTDSSGWKTKLKRVDFLGALIMVCAVFALLLGLDRGCNVSWSSPLTITALSVSLPLFILFIVVEEKLAAEPFAPGRIIFERSLFACYLCNFFSFAGWLSMLFYLPLFYQAVNGFSASQAGVRLLPGIVAGVSGSLFGGILMKRTGKYYWLTVTAYSMLALGE